MSVYAGRHAELYDLFYAEKDYAREAAFAHDLLEAHATGPVRRVLDLACGTGRHALALEGLGLRVTGVDASAAMVGVARRRAARHGAALDVLEQDMRVFDAGRAPFDGVVCLFDSLGYLLSNEAIGATLRRVHDHLRPGGAFVCEFWHAPAMLRQFEPTRVRRLTGPAGEILRVAETTIDVPTQTAEVTYTIHEFGRDGRTTTLREQHRNRFFQVQEMALFLSGAGLEPLAWRAGYDATAPIDLGTWHVLAVARRPAEPS